MQKKLISESEIRERTLTPLLQNENTPYCASALGLWIAYGNTEAGGEIEIYNDEDPTTESSLLASRTLNHTAEVENAAAAAQAYTYGISWAIQHFHHSDSAWGDLPMQALNALAIAYDAGKKKHDYPIIVPVMNHQMEFCYPGKDRHIILRDECDEQRDIKFIYGLKAQARGIGFTQGVIDFIDDEALSLDDLANCDVDIYDIYKAAINDAMAFPVDSCTI